LFFVQAFHFLGTKDPDELVGGNHKLLCGSGKQRICRRIQQQAQSAEATLLWNIRHGSEKQKKWT
jgi:hypothetical protein